VEEIRNFLIHKLVYNYIKQLVGGLMVQDKSKENLKTNLIEIKESILNGLEKLIEKRARID